MTVLSIYATQADLNVSVKDLFYEIMQWTLTKISASQILFVCVYFKGHNRYEGVRDGRGFGRHNLEGEKILEFAVPHNLVVSNSFFTKRESHLVTYHQSRENQIRIDYILVKRQNVNLVRDVKVIPNEECNPTQTTCFSCKNSKN